MKIDDGWTVDLEHRVVGSPEEVFEYFTDPDKLKRWQGVDVELDPRPGGAFNISSAPDVWMRGTYEAVEPPNRVVVSWGFETKEIPLPRGLAQVPVGASAVEFTFTPDGDGTIIHVRHSGLPTEESQWAHEQGWVTYITRLGRVLEGTDPGEEPTVDLAARLYAHDAEIDARS